MADIQDLASAVKSGDRAALPRAITLVRIDPARSPRAGRTAGVGVGASRRAAGRHQTLRVGITGVPGVGKSTTIEALGMYLIDQGDRVAVLAVDPSSTRTGGSILGDKTRMAKLAVHPDAYISAPRRRQERLGGGEGHPGDNRQQPSDRTAGHTRGTYRLN